MSQASGAGRNSIGPQRAGQSNLREAHNDAAEQGHREITQRSRPNVAQPFALVFFGARYSAEFSTIARPEVIIRYGPHQRPNHSGKKGAEKRVQSGHTGREPPE